LATIGTLQNPIIHSLCHRFKPIKYRGSAIFMPILQYTMSIQQTPKHINNGILVQYNTVRRSHEPPTGDSSSPFIEPRVININQHIGHAYICLGTTRNLNGTAHTTIQPAVGLLFGTMETTFTATSITSHHRSPRNSAHRSIPIQQEKVVNFKPILQKTRPIQWMP